VSVISSTFKGLLALGGAVALGTVGAKRAAAKVADHPDRFPADVVGADPAGETVWIDRPDGTRIRAIVSGEGPTVVLTHGYGMSLKTWSIVQPMLADRGRRVISFDWRGHGQTTVGSEGITPEVVAADFAAVLDHFDVHDGVLVGHSTGGYLSIAMLLTQPGSADRLTGLLLMATLAGDASVDAPQTKLQIPLITSGLMDKVVANDSLGLLFAASIWGPDPSPAALRVFLDDFASQDHQALVGLLTRMSTTSFYDRLDEITLPTIVLAGEDDRTTPRWHSETLAARIPNARSRWLPRTGHAINWQRPEAVVDAVEELLAER
jgi:non-heme chloroperoxidase